MIGHVPFDLSYAENAAVFVQEQYKADAESWSSEQAALQANLAALAAQTALKSLALDAMMRNNRGSQMAGGHAIGGPLWQQVCFAFLSSSLQLDKIGLYMRSRAPHHIGKVCSVMCYSTFRKLASAWFRQIELRCQLSTWSESSR